MFGLLIRPFWYLLKIVFAPVAAGGEYEPHEARHLMRAPLRLHWERGANGRPRARWDASA